jgi:uncharacterized protein (DUF427 family)
VAKAVWQGAVVAESDKTIEVEGNRYFPPDAIRKQYFKPSARHTVCPWKGTASYYAVEGNGKHKAGAAWYHPEPKPAASQIKDHVVLEGCGSREVDSVVSGKAGRAESGLGQVDDFSRLLSFSKSSALASPITK